MIKLLKYLILAVGIFAIAHYVQAETVIKIYTADDDKPEFLGTITAEDSQYGLLIIPDLHDLTPGIHGFHFHENASCANGAMAAGGHLDPKNTGKHLGPYDDNGHLGDLPPLFVAKDGTATLPILAPRLQESDIASTAIMIHAGGENFSDTPEQLGGGGARMACGVVDPS